MRQCGAGEKAGVLENLNCSSESHDQLHNNFDNYNVLGDRDSAWKILRRIMWSCGVSTRYACTDAYVQVNHIYVP